MKKMIYAILLCPFWAISQPTVEELIFEISTMQAKPEHTAQVKSAMAAHNKKYHASGPHGCRVYTVASGPHSGEYKWVMGPGPWSALDTRPSDDAHDMDWENNVAKYMAGDVNNTEYIRFDPKLSRFPEDFNVNKLVVWYVGISRGKEDKVKEILEKVHKVYAEKIPDETYGIYFNALNNSSSGRDLVIVSFFDKYAWMGTEDGFESAFEEMYGKGSLKTMFDEWLAATYSDETEIWEFQADLSGLPALVKAAERQ